MIKRLVCFLFVLAPLCLSAGNVSPEKAKKAAANLLKVQGSRSSSVKQVYEPVYLTKSTQGDAPYYIFEGDRGGFVILTADDRLFPVIGWSANGSLSDGPMPAHFKAWLDMWSRITDAVRSGKAAAQEGAREQWEEVYKESQPLYAAGKVLETANWNQTSPFNSLCNIDGRTCLTGCVATATSIVMRYHKWPTAGVGILPEYSYTDDGGTKRYVSSITLGHEYDWDNMPLDLSTDSDASAQQEVARLIYEVGVMIQSNYNIEGTGAYTRDVYKGLTDFFLYDPSGFMYDKCYYTDSQWTKLLKDNIDNVGPIVYSGYGTDGQAGHAFVLDGYNAQGQFRINWGWGGNNNGYYTMPAFDEFTEGHGAILNIKKLSGGNIAEGLFIDGNGKGKGLTGTETQYEVGKAFDVVCEYIFNLSSRIFTGEVALAVMHRDGSIGEIIDTGDITILAEFGTTISCTECVITEPINIGDRICLWYRSENTPEWTPIAANVENGDIAEIAIEDANSLEEVTSVRYTSASKELVISTKKDAEWSITDSDGNSYADNISYEDGVITIDTAQFEQKSYFLTLSKRNDSKTIELVFGSK